jgi:hypothetical protein
VISALADTLVETVASGGSVSFMHPLAPDVAAAFWTTSLAAAEAGGRVVLGAMEDGAGPFYEKLGFVKAGVIPDYALKPYGGLCGTIIYWKRIGVP